MKKIIAIASLAVIAVSVLASCGGGKFYCDNCEQEKTGKKYTKTFMGETFTYCKDCKDEVEAAFAFLGALGEMDFD